MGSKIIKGDALIKKLETLVVVEIDDIEWKVYYKDKFNGEKWVKEFPFSDRHGGGEPQLKLLTLFPWEKGRKNG